MHQKYLIFLIISFSLILNYTYSQQKDKINGVTIDAVNKLNNIVNSIYRHKQDMTARIVFDEWQPASGYVTAVNRIDTVCYIMGEILDSYYMSRYSVLQFQQRVEEYVDLLGNKVDIWEIGNEANGEWLGNIDTVIAKIYYAFRYVEKREYKHALTLYYNKNCWERPENEMFRWVNERLLEKMRLNLDYVFISYYEDDCNNYQPDWQRVFDSLHVLFPDSKLGIGECGTLYANRKEEYINRYYSMNITTPGYVGGYFWWYYRQDCVPWNTKPLWQVLENAMNNNGKLVLPGDKKSKN